MHLRSLYCFWLLLVSFTVSKVEAQSIVSQLSPKVDTAYVDLSYDSWSVRVIGIYKYQNPVIRNGAGNKVRFVPKNPTSIGLGLAYKFLAIDIGVRLLLIREDVTSRFDLQGEASFGNHLVDLTVQRYKGFDQEGAMRSIFRNDIRSTVVGANYLYNFNSKKLSIRSVFTGNRRQKKSAGSFTVGGFISVQDIAADSSIVAGEEGFDERAQLQNSRFNIIGIQGGYNYMLVLPYRFYVFGGLTPGMGLLNGEVTATDHYDINSRLVTKLNIRAAVGHNGQRFYSGIVYGSDIFFMNISADNKFNYNIGKLKLVIGYKFNRKLKFLDEVLE
ncbi:DUF4421 family protein [Fulvivirga sp.]|uniref:DUF4421 family protein n=1 Tax=Fulvivirga sp. TaxID=1931237 RepID=UPI0032EB354B